MLSWDDLRVFLAVARGGSFSAAARALGVAQPTVGRRIAELERALGSELFVHTPQGQTLSPAGRATLVPAERMELEALAAERLASGRAGLRGPVSLTASDWLVSSVLAPLVAPLLERHPGVELELITDTRHLNLLRREADLALRPSRFEQAEIVQRQVALLRFGLYASDAYLARHGPPDFARQCAGHGLIAMSESLGKVPEVAWLPSFASHARVVARCNGREPMLTLALAGLGLVCLPRFLGDRAGLRLLPTPEPAPERALYLGMHRDARKQARVRACADFLAERLAQLGPLLAA